MPALSLTLDYALKMVKEPGFHEQIPARRLAHAGAAKVDSSSPLHLWLTPIGDVVMLRPLQLDPTWLNSTQQLPSIIRLDQLTVNASDIANVLVYERGPFGNTADPWIFHVPTLPSTVFPYAPNPDGHPLPESGLTLAGISPGVDISTQDVTAVRPNAGYQLPTVLPPSSSPPAPAQVVDSTTGRHVCATQGRLAANQPLFLRWYQAPKRIAFPPVQRFFIGQFCLDVKEGVVQVFQDTSAAGDRSHFGHLVTLPLFTQAAYKANNDFSWQSIADAQEPLGHDRALLWVPMRRNQILIYASSGAAALIQARAQPVRLPDNSDWNIVRSDTLIVWVLTPVHGRFQIQKVAYWEGDVYAQTDPVVLDYTPVATPNTTISWDADHGSSLSLVQTSPVAYSLPINNTFECPKIPASATTIQSNLYGYELHFKASSDGQWTPFFYNVAIDLDAVLVTPTSPTPLTINDTTTANSADIVQAEVFAGLKPGEGRATIELIDPTPFPLGNYYYRCGMPIQLTRDSTPIFTGYTLPSAVVPIHLGGNNPRRLTMNASDRWYQLTNTYLRGNKNWQGVGHVDVVKSILQQSGVDTTGWETPPITPSNNTIVGDLPTNQTPQELAGQLNGVWQPKPGETAAAFLKRIMEHFSLWNLVFYPDGTVSYHPRYYFTTSEVTFYESEAAATADGHSGAPVFRDVTFSNIEPEANAILVKAMNRQTGGPLFSSLWVDWASIQNPNAVNYLGRRKTEVVEIAGYYSCSGINWAARTIFAQTRRRHVIARFAADYSASVKVDHCLTLHGYGLYRVRSYSCRFRKRGFLTMAIEAELVEKGFGI